MNIGIGIGIGVGSNKADEPSVSVSRLYLSSAQTVVVTPAFGAWDSSVGAVRRKLLNAKEAGESIASVTFTPDMQLQAVRQYVSLPLVAQTISGNVKGQARMRDTDANGDASVRLSARVTSGDGLTVRGTLLAIADYGTGFIFSSLRNKTLANGDAVTPVVAQAGDLLVIEIGFDAPSSSIVQFSFGAPSATADLPEDETTTTAIVPWIEFSAGILFQA